MKKVLIFVDALYEGGVSKVLLDLLENINRDKYDITVMTLYNQGIYIEIRIDGTRSFALQQKRLNLLSAVTKDKYKVIRNFFKYRPYMYCTRKMLIIAIGYIILSLFLPVSEIAYIKALMVTTKYIAFYFLKKGSIILSILF